MEGNAQFSPCRRYRYSLRRNWIGGSGTVNFIGLNPSTADETLDDPTIRRCIGFAKLWGFESLVMLNLFAWRATNRKEIRRVSDPVGPDNDAALREHIIWPDRLTVAAWGTDGTHLGRADTVRAMFPELSCLRLTKDGHPEHPLYLPKDLTPAPYGPPNRAVEAASNVCG